MQLTRFTDLGLRVLMYLTYHDRDGYVTISEIADQFAVPHNHLIKVVNKLGKLGWIYAVRGRNGGLKLVSEPSQLKLGRILRELEGSTQLIDCETPVCALNAGCRLKAALDVGLEAFYTAMDTYTLADIVATPTGDKIIQMHRQYINLHLA
ncbi:Rrf2 family nitric oxide-sensitive transcriptional repressor [Chitinivorax tropicus]|uniref:Rrf2 family nitric oxide-sensitive transcriptional repressor n=1 Tax=Chitinivorax tropicus TaxID=714531 RepID=A0A840MJ07_9PROT|nr:Rrf2 family transcriptional regulator [Chitinivorax tropicus]MBB5017495.1 Rrf2 family nitric oxide-sensitive transcriptional repressor [Chitinivorax tropicus]